MEEKKCFGKYEDFHVACILCGASDDCKKYTEDGEESKCPICGDEMSEFPINNDDGRGGYHFVCEKNHSQKG